MDYLEQSYLLARFEDLGNTVRNRRTGRVLKAEHPYPTIRVGPASVGKQLLHRVLWIMRHGPIPEGAVIDHRDGDPLNRSVGNLRAISGSQNQYNREFSRIMNVYHYGAKGRWYVKVQANGVSHSGGIFDNYDAACAAADALRYKLHGEFRR